MLYIAFVCIFLSIFLFTYNKNHLSKKEYSGLYNDLCCLEQYTLQFTMNSWTIIMHLRLECKHIITVTHTKFTRAI